MAYAIKKTTRVSNLKPRHIFTTQEVRGAVQSAVMHGYGEALSKKSSTETCVASLAHDLVIQPYRDLTLPVSMLKRPRREASPRSEESPQIEVVTPLPPVTPPPPAPIPEPAPLPKVPETTVLPLVPDKETTEETYSDDEATAVAVNTAANIGKCKRVRCGRERYKRGRGMCKSHYYAWRKKGGNAFV